MNVVVSRQQLINWINDSLNLNVTRIEDLGIGSVYLQLMDYINVTTNENESFPMHQVYWTKDILFEDQIVNEENKRLRIIKNPQLSGRDQMMSNYKLLQKWFQELKISKNIPIDKLILCKFQNNLEFLQWIFKHFMLVIKSRGFESPDEFLRFVRKENLYDPISRRFAGCSSGGSSSSTTSRRSSVLRNRSTASSDGSNASLLSTKRAVSNAAAARRTSSLNNCIGSPSGGKLANGQSSAGNSRKSSGNRASGFAKSSPVTDSTNFGPRDSVNTAELMAKYESIIHAINTERQFYFDKLRSLELLILTIQENNNIEEDSELQQLITHILKILYFNSDGEKENGVVDTIGDVDNEVKKTNLDAVADPQRDVLSIDDSEMF